MEPDYAIELLKDESERLWQEMVKARNDPAKHKGLLKQRKSVSRALVAIGLTALLRQVVADK